MSEYHKIVIVITVVSLRCRRDQHTPITIHQSINNKIIINIYIIINGCRRGRSDRPSPTHCDNATRYKNNNI